MKAKEPSSEHFEEMFGSEDVGEPADVISDQEPSEPVFPDAGRRLLEDAFETMHRLAPGEIDPAVLLSSMSHGVVALSRAGDCLYLSDAAAEMLRGSPTDLVGKEFHGKILPMHKDGSPYPYEASPLFAALTFRQASSENDELFWRFDGTTFPVSYSVTPIVVDSIVNGAVLVFEDRTTRKLLESQLAQADRMTSLGRLAASVAQEFDDVLERLQPAVELVERNAGTNGELQLALGIFEQSIERGRRLARKILQYTDSKRPAMEPIDVVQWMQTFLEHVRRVIPTTIVLAVKAPVEPLYLLGNLVQLNQVFMNLVLNARDAMPKGGRLTIGAEPCLSGTKFAFGVVETPDQFIHFSVGDTGCGIPAEIMPRIFEPLFTTKVTSSAGLGLAVCHQLVQRHGGSIFAESTVDEGTTFHIFIPATYPEIFHDDTLPETKARRVILVEDPTTVATMTNLADFVDLELEIVQQPSDLSRFVEQFGPHAIVLHASRLDTDGLEIYCELAREWPSLPILISTTGVPPPPRRLDAPENMAYLPYDVETILKSIEAASNG